VLNLNYNFDKVVQRKNTNCLKWDCTKDIFGTEDILPLWVADMDFEIPKEIVESIKKRADHAVLGYSRPSEAYFSSIIKWLEKRHNFKIHKDYIVPAAGVVPSIVFSLLAFTKQKNKVLVQSPVYYPFFSTIKNNERELVNCPLKLENNTYIMDFENIEKQFKAGVKATIFCNPHNPVGRVWTKEELLKFASLCLKYNVLIISDEIHSDLVFKPNKHIPIASLSDEIAQNTITLMAPSKTFNIAALSCSFVIIPNKDYLIKYKKVVSDLFVDSNNPLNLAASEAAYTYGEPWLDALIEYLEDNINFLIEFLEEKIPAIKIRKPQGTYLLWLDCKALGMENDTLEKFFVEKAGVGLSNGSVFGEGSEGFFRINVACPRLILKEALEKIGNALNELNY
jgi:cystathionine beta-lyase